MAKESTVPVQEEIPTWCDAMHLFSTSDSAASMPPDAFVRRCVRRAIRQRMIVLDRTTGSLTLTAYGKVSWAHYVKWESKR